MSLFRYHQWQLGNLPIYRVHTSLNRTQIYSEESRKLDIYGLIYTLHIFTSL